MISALNKYWRPVTYDQYMDEMDIPAVNNAVAIAGFPEVVTDWIWEKKRTPFEITAPKRKY